MRFSEFKKEVKQKRVKVTIPLTDLEQYHPANDKRVILVKDPRSYQTDGKWNIYPIRINSDHVYIVCPYCGEIHVHGNSKGCYEGWRCPHCKDGDVRKTPNYNILRYVPELNLISAAELQRMSDEELAAVSMKEGD